jgi:hypothetical protein
MISGEAGGPEEAEAIAREIRGRQSAAAAASAPAIAGIQSPATPAASPDLSSKSETAEHQSFRFSGSGRTHLRWRKMTWAIHIWNTLFLIWIIYGVVSVSNISAADSCASDPTVLNGILSQQQCEDASNAGTAIGASIGFGAVLSFWFVGFLVLSVVWLMTRGRTRLCPVCGEDVKKGATVCKSCGHDFALAFAAAS